MVKITKLFLILTIACLTAVISNSVNAQEDQGDQTPNLISTQTSQDNAMQEVNIDEQVSPEDLSVKDQKFLPDNPFYFLKDWARKIQSAVTFNKVKKAELENKFANEKLVELKKLVEKNADSEIIKKATENYKKATEKVKEKADKIGEIASESQEVNKFLDNFVKQQVLQEKVLQKLESQVPTEVFEKIKEARETHLEKFGEVMTKLEDRTEEIKKKIENALDKEEGSQFKNFKNLEILKNIEEKIPEKAKEAIQQAQENALKRLGGDLEKMSPEDQDKFKDYINKISGDKEKQAEILENIKSTTSEKPELQEKLIQAREKIIEKVEIKNEQKNCPAIKKTAADFCKEDRIVPQKDNKGCIVEFKCAIPAETETPSSECKSACKEIGTKSEGWYNSCTNELIKLVKCSGENPINYNTGVCITLWDPVCGIDGKTYSNKCYTKMVGVEIAYKGECGEQKCNSDTDCGSPKLGMAVKCVENKCVYTYIKPQCRIDADCPQVKCGATTAVAAKCLGVVAKCVEGRCVTANTSVQP